jgi:hypothetical protein
MEAMNRWKMTGINILDWLLFTFVGIAIVAWISMRSGYRLDLCGHLIRVLYHWSGWWEDFAISVDRALLQYRIQRRLRRCEPLCESLGRWRFEMTEADWPDAYDSIQATNPVESTAESTAESMAESTMESKVEA